LSKYKEDHAFPGYAQRGGREIEVISSIWGSTG